METKLNEVSITDDDLLEAGVPPKPLTKSSQNKRKGFLSRTWAWYVNNEYHWIEKNRGILIVAALMIAGMPFYSGINPPGSTLLGTRNGRFMYQSEMDDFNQFVGYTSFTMVTSFAIILVLISGLPLSNKFVIWVLTLGTMFTMVTMVLNYWASLGNFGPDGNVDTTSVWTCLIFIFVCGVIALVHTIFFVVWVVMMLLKCRMPEIDRKMNQDDDVGEV